MNVYKVACINMVTVDITIKTHNTIFINSNQSSVTLLPNITYQSLPHTGSYQCKYRLGMTTYPPKALPSSKLFVFEKKAAAQNLFDSMNYHPKPFLNVALLEGIGINPKPLSGYYVAWCSTQFIEWWNLYPNLRKQGEAMTRTYASQQTILVDGFTPTHVIDWQIERNT